MNRPTLPLLVNGLAWLAVAACSGREATETTIAEAPAEKAKPPHVDAQELREPCDWLTREEVTEVFGTLAGEPVRVLTAESVTPDPGGSACAYPVSVEGGTTSVSVQVDPEGAMDVVMANQTMVGVIAREQGAEEPADTGPSAQDGWDDVDGVPGEGIWRIGHVAVRIGERSGRLPEEKFARLAQRVRGKMADKPFLNPERSAEYLADEERSPCKLLTRAEAEAVLGPLAVDPFTSHKGTALADQNGEACTYYSAGHKALVVKPVWADGKEQFGWVAGLGGRVRSGVGGSDQGDLLDGPWEQATAGMDGALYFLDGDVMLQVVYRTSLADMERAAKLAAIAMPRLKAGS